MKPFSINWVFKFWNFGVFYDVFVHSHLYWIGIVFLHYFFLFLWIWVLKTQISKYTQILMVPDSFFQIGVSLEIITLDRFYKKIPKCFIFRQTRRFRGTVSVNTYGKNWFESLSSILRYFCCCLFGSAYWDKLSLKCTLSCVRYSEYRYHDNKTTLAKIKH